MRRLLAAVALAVTIAGCSTGNVTHTLGRQESRHAQSPPDAEIGTAITTPPTVCWIESEPNDESGIYGGDPTDAPKPPTFIRWTTCPDTPLTP